MAPKLQEPHGAKRECRQDSPARSRKASHVPAESSPQQRVAATSPVECEEEDPASHQGAGGRRGTPPCEGAAWAITGLRRGRARPGPPWGQIEGCLWPLARACDASQLLTVEHHLRAYQPGQELEHCQSPCPSL